MSTLRIGLIGAGGNTRQRHIPGFRVLDGVEIVAVANRSPASSRRACEEHGIATAHATWRELVADPEVDAVCIGTWPDSHAPITVAALEAGKHVLCEARMARCHADAVAMDTAARARPELVAQIVPAPFTLRYDEAIQRLLAEGAIGRPVAVELRVGQGPRRSDAPSNWRMDPAISGVNTMALGIHYETILRWLGPATRVAARAQVVTSHRREEGGGIRALSIPDHLEVLGELACGASLNLRISSVSESDVGDGVLIHGSDGRLVLRADTLSLQRAQGEPESVPPTVADDGWRVEAEFVASIREGAPVRRTDFATGRHYMAFSEAVLRAAAVGSWEPVPPL